MKRLVLQELSHPELSEYMNDIKVAIVPTGSQEQHGPNMTFSTDTDRAYEMAKLLAERMFPRVLVLAPVTYGVSYHHMKFPGTVTLKPETLAAVYIEIAQSMKQHGINKVFFLNAHGGNRPALGVAIARIRFELEMQTAWMGAGTDIVPDLLSSKDLSKVRGHACEGEVAQSMHIAPWLVKENNLTKAELNDTLYDKRFPWWNIPWDFKEVTANGALGDARKATKELGKEMTDLILKRIEQFMAAYFFEEALVNVDLN